VNAGRQEKRAGRLRRYRSPGGAAAGRLRPLVQGKSQAALDHRRRGGPEPGAGAGAAQDSGLAARSPTKSGT